MRKVIFDPDGLETVIMAEIGMYVKPKYKADALKRAAHDLIAAHTVDMPDVVEREATISTVDKYNPTGRLDVAVGVIKSVPAWTGKEDS